MALRTKILLVLLALAIAVPLVLNVLVGIIRLVFWIALAAVVVGLIFSWVRGKRHRHHH